MLLVAADYGQLEVRIAAFQSRDPLLMEIVNSPPGTPAGDMHAQTLARVFNIPFEKQDEHKPLRTQAKVYNFTSIYGGKEDRIVAGIEEQALLHLELGIVVPTKAQARRDLQGLRQTYRGYFLEYVPAAVERARERGGIAYTAFGRPRLIPNLFSKDKGEREAAERIVPSHEVQGTAADIARYATYEVNKILHGILLTICGTHAKSSHSRHPQRAERPQAVARVP